MTVKELRKWLESYDDSMVVTVAHGCSWGCGGIKEITDLIEIDLIEVEGYIDKDNNIRDSKAVCILM